jgi:hypothetical protein
MERKRGRRTNQVEELEDPTGRGIAGGFDDLEDGDDSVLADDGRLLVHVLLVDRLVRLDLNP